MTTPTVGSASALGRDLLASWVASGGAPTVPAGRRAEVVATLTRCMVSEPMLSAYTGALEAGWGAHRDRAPMAGYPAAAIPEAQIFRDGFATLDDRALGDIAVDPHAVRAVYDAINLPPAAAELFVEPGRWFFDALDEVEGPGRGASTGPMDLGLRGDGTGPNATPAEPSARPAVDHSPGRGTGRRGRWTDLLPWAVAAAALLCAGLIWVANRKPETGDRTNEVLVASAAQTNAEPKGANSIAFNLALGAQRDGFATVLIIPTERPPRVYPDYGADEEKVGPGVNAAVGPFEAPAGSTVITIVTQTPATDVVRRAVRNLPPGQTAPDAVVAVIRERLFSSGHRWAAFGTTTVTAAKQ